MFQSQKHPGLDISYMTILCGHLPLKLQLVRPSSLYIFLSFWDYLSPLKVRTVCVIYPALRAMPNT